MKNTNPDDLLKSANPYPADGAGEPHPQTGFDTYLEEILMTTETPIRPVPQQLLQSGRPVNGPGWKKRMAVPLATAAVLLAAIFVGQNVIGPSNPAAAEMIAAAEASGEIDSGLITVEIEFNEFEPEPALARETDTANTEYRYEGNRSYQTVTFPGEDPAELIVIGSDTYHRGFHLWPNRPDEVNDKFVLVTEEEAKDDTLSVENIIQPESSKPEAIIPLLKLSEDFHQTSSNEGTTTYSGTIPRSKLLQLDADEVPAGLSLILDDTDEPILPETIGVDVTVVDDKLDTLIVLVQGETAEGYVDAVITSRFSEYGEPQDIVAPPESNVQSVDEFFLTGAPLEIVAANETLNEFRENDSATCRAEEEAFFEAAEVPRSMSEHADIVEPLSKEYLTCLEAEAPPEVFAAARLLHG